VNLAELESGGWLYRWFFPILWVVFIGIWIAMARGGKVVAERESAFSRLSHYLPLAIAIYLLMAPHIPIPVLDERFVPLSLWPVRLGAALTFAGAAFAVWARMLLAGNWSSDVTLKRDHELIVAGPYAFVRHPIYTGILIALAGTALAVGEWRGVLAVVLALAAFWRKLKIEETVMRRQFGGAYARYAGRVPALVPFVL
jgi:protein-S-isoprenylcysteine O-methyltransferase Ste14